MTVVGYARVSTQDQQLDGQLAALKAAGATSIFREKASGKHADRPALVRMLKQLRPGDCVVVTRLDRLGRGLRDLVNILHDLDRAGVGFRSIGDPWCDTRSPTGKLMLAVIGGLAEYERSLIVSRTSEGRKRAMAAGVRFGRPKMLDSFQQQEALQRRRNGEPLSLIARSYKVRPLVGRGIAMARPQQGDQTRAARRRGLDPCQHQRLAGAGGPLDHHGKGGNALHFSSRALLSHTGTT